MSTYSRSRRARLRDFQRRLRHESSTESHNGFRYISIHPLADDLETLDRLGLRPSDCTSVDCWWEVGNGVALLEVRALATSARAKPHCRAICWGSPPSLRLRAFVQEPEITSQVLTDVMDQIKRAGVPGRGFCRGRHRRSMMVCNLHSPSPRSR